MPSKAGIQFVALGPRFRGDERMHYPFICFARNAIDRSQAILALSA
jgi:hypothetical protein